MDGYSSRKASPKIGSVLDEKRSTRKLMRRVEIN
jgi:hypothetical protein